MNYELDEDERAAVLKAIEAMFVVSGNLSLQTAIAKLRKKDDGGITVPLWRTLPDEEQDTLALLKMDEVRDCVKDIAHEFLDQMGQLSELAYDAGIDPDLVAHYYKTGGDFNEMAEHLTSIQLEEIRDNLPRWRIYKLIDEQGRLLPDGRLLLKDYADFADEDFDG